MMWMNALIFLAIGVLLGLLIARFNNKDLAQQKNLKKELDLSKYELEQYRQELSDHFARSAELLENISKDYNKLYQHMAKTSVDLMPNLSDQDNPFTASLRAVEALEEDHSDIADPAQPRDYANGASGALKDEMLTKQAS
ncbi:Inner membrane protein YhcB [Vibrio stylophorae]|uniref:Z-ring associated protein G n=1 Tax=Vibrio stylophorae TaxID=659351 RepID=A0ABM8ZRJ9_9VIBR|nr:Z-ring associated protein ZapG [Vibrio stylophorae]CAH0532512.1 Inner membrane protein YhcB [Vibrio stylophorae]